MFKKTVSPRQVGSQRDNHGSWQSWRVTGKALGQRQVSRMPVLADDPREQTIQALRAFSNNWSPCELLAHRHAAGPLTCHWCVGFLLELLGGSEWALRMSRQMQATLPPDLSGLAPGVAQDRRCAAFLASLEPCKSEVGSASGQRSAAGVSQSVMATGSEPFPTWRTGSGALGATGWQLSTAKPKTLDQESAQARSVRIRDSLKKWIKTLVPRWDRRARDGSLERTHLDMEHGRPHDRKVHLCRRAPLTRSWWCRLRREEGGRRGRMRKSEGRGEVVWRGEAVSFVLRCVVSHQLAIVPAYRAASKKKRAARRSKRSRRMRSSIDFPVCLSGHRQDACQCMGEEVGKVCARLNKL